jgi:hypothetical protein
VQITCLPRQGFGLALPYAMVLPPVDLSLMKSLSRTTWTSLLWRAEVSTVWSQEVDISGGQ